MLIVNVMEHGKMENKMEQGLGELRNAQKHLIFHW